VAEGIIINWSTLASTQTGRRPMVTAI